VLLQDRKKNVLLPEVMLFGLPQVFADMLDFLLAIRIYGLDQELGDA
jgi:hypothetical protein